MPDSDESASRNETTRGIRISGRLWIPFSEIEVSAIRAQGAGGQHVNTTSTAIQLRFDIAASSLPEPIKKRLHAQRDSRLSRKGVLVIKSQENRSQAMNREAAIKRLVTWLQAASQPAKPRIPTRQPASVNRRRLQDKLQRSMIKKLRSAQSDS